MMRNIRIGTFALMTAAAITCASAQSTNGKPGPLMIQEQGSFAVGGTVRTNAGSF